MIDMDFSRRDFVASGAAALGAAALSASAEAAPRGKRRKLAPSDTVNVAIIGAGGMGNNNANNLVSQNIVALADVDFEHVARAFLDDKGQPNPERDPLKAKYDAAAKYADYRRMFDAQKDIDAVVIATPDHHHAAAAKMAMERGLHVYVQKPMAYSVHEGRLLLDLARKNPKLVTQMGNQGHSGDDGRRVVELIRGGVIGRVREVHVWTNRPVWPQGIAKPDPVDTPASLDWDMWLGPASVDWGYNPDYGHFNWRGWVPFGVGALGDMGAHLIDFPVWALEPGLPTRIESRHSRWGGDTNPWDRAGPEVLTSYPLASVTHYEFANAPGGPVTMIWYDGGLMPPTPKGIPSSRLDPGGGVMFVGETGYLIHETYGENPILFGEGVADKAAAIPVSLPRISGGIGGHEMNWIRAIRGEEGISNPFEMAVPLNETMVLGMVAMKADQPIAYDGRAVAVTNVLGANQYLTREYRKGWEL
ncbi:Gfo/Idh/MocA family oxidoreductase [Sphingomonas piscis]|uniref:Gfo/Idh/MocA family oxidoreductase n=1 Tax=Sphingomonas piscis TaxID=2714943 RepID=A0A6G7YNG9_9SPHN|nr:Gfo/Idh/MocA family oxidoreductase [Sphingomonas piscis]QIK78266.1 Gfo/Idh/MocA family oxidoreductase [Sphingomonas piscis]